MRDKYWISLIGCDGTTRFRMELTDDGYELLKSVSELSRRMSDCCCKPILEVVHEVAPKKEEE